MDNKEVAETIEYLRLTAALSMLLYVEKDAEMAQFFKTLVRNGCPLDAIAKTLLEMRQEHEDNHRNRKTDKSNEW